MQKRSALWVAVAVLLVVTFFTLFACCCPGRRSVAPIASPPLPPAPQVPVPLDVVPAKETEVQMRNVRFHTDAHEVLHINELRGQMFAKESGQPLNLDDKNTFIVRIFTAQIGVDGATLTDLMNNHVFNYPGSPLKNLVVTVQDGHLVQEGMMHKIIDIPFRMIADVSATSDGRLRIHPTKIEICNLNGEALMRAFGMSLEKILTKVPKGVQVEKNDLIIEPLTILPPPKIEGTMKSVRVEGDQLVQEFDDGRSVAPLELPEPARNYIDFQHGTLRMGKLYMVSADMEVIDMDPNDPFDFYLDRYNEQLVAGYDKNRLNYGLTVRMRDFEDLGKPAN